MDEIFNIVGMRSVNFKDAKTGQAISGIRFYYTLDDSHITGVGTGSFFLSEAKAKDFPFLSVGSVVRPAYNKYGKIASLEEM